MVTAFHLPNHLLPHSLHAVLHGDKLARHCFSMGGTEEQCEIASVCLCFSVCGGYVGKMCVAE